MKKSILVAVIYIIVFSLEILAYYISKESAIFVYGIITLFAFIFTFGAALAYDDQNIILLNSRNLNKNENS